MTTNPINRACVCCGQDNPVVVKEYHHIYGKANGPETILLCYNCHTIITHNQNKFPPKERSKKADLINRRNFEDATIGSLLELIGKRIRTRGDKHG
jgi:hypothetical protein